MAKDAIYQEIHVSSERGAPRPKFPKTCPVCGAETVETKRPAYHGGDRRRYACGGAYEPKPQIQNHTDKWWGRCGR